MIQLYYRVFDTERVEQGRDSLGLHSHLTLKHTSHRGAVELSLGSVLDVDVGALRLDCERFTVLSIVHTTAIGDVALGIFKLNSCAGTRVELQLLSCEGQR